MQRKDALALVGRRVSAWTAANGSYVGVLEEITDDRPFRARVRIDGVLSPACCYEIGRTTPRRGYRVGELIEVGNSSVAPTDKQGNPDYLAVLRAEGETFARSFQDYQAGKHGNPEDPHVAKHYRWHEQAAKQIATGRRRIGVLVRG
jgi:hypothetical protein